MIPLPWSTIPANCEAKINSFLPHSALIKYFVRTGYFVFPLDAACFTVPVSRLTRIIARERQQLSSRTKHCALLGGASSGFNLLWLLPWPHLQPSLTIWRYNAGQVTQLLRASSVSSNPAELCLQRLFRHTEKTPFLLLWPELDYMLHTTFCVDGWPPDSDTSFSIQ